MQKRIGFPCEVKNSIENFTYKKIIKQDVSDKKSN